MALYLHMHIYTRFLYFITHRCTVILRYTQLKHTYTSIHSYTLVYSYISIHCYTHLFYAHVYRYRDLYPAIYSYTHINTPIYTYVSRHSFALLYTALVCTVEETIHVTDAVV